MLISQQFWAFVFSAGHYRTLQGSYLQGADLPTISSQVSCLTQSGGTVISSAAIPRQGYESGHGRMYVCLFSPQDHRMPPYAAALLPDKTNLAVLFSIRIYERAPCTSILVTAATQHTGVQASVTMHKSPFPPPAQDSRCTHASRFRWGMDGGRE